MTCKFCDILSLNSPPPPPFLQCSSLIDQNQYDDFVDELKEEYEEVREDHYDSLKVCVMNWCYYIFPIDLMHWRHRAAMLGVKAIALYALLRLAHFWQLLFRVILLTPLTPKRWRTLFLRWRDVICILRSILLSYSSLFYLCTYMYIFLFYSISISISIGAKPPTFDYWPLISLLILTSSDTEY